MSQVKLASGMINIDGKDISQMGLYTVRRALSIIPQVRHSWLGALSMLTHSLTHSLSTVCVVIPRADSPMT